MEITEKPNAFEAAVDTWLAETYEAKSNLVRKYNQHAGTVKYAAAGDSRDNELTLYEAIQICNEALASDETVHLNYYSRSTVKDALDEIVRLADEIAKLGNEAQDLNDLYTGWSRFYLVTNTNGHIHSSLRCSTCYIDTEFAWLPELSGLTEEDAVAEYGGILCSVCFPSAPVEYTNGVNKKTQAEKDERAAERAAKKAAQDAKKVYNPDGSELRDDYGSVIKTLVTAQRELSNALQYEYMDYGPKYTEYAERLAEAIAYKTGADKDTLLKEGREKAAKKVEAEKRKYANGGVR